MLDSHNTIQPEPTLGETLVQSGWLSYFGRGSTPGTIKVHFYDYTAPRESPYRTGVYELPEVLFRAIGNDE